MPDSDNIWALTVYDETKNIVVFYGTSADPSNSDFVEGKWVDVFIPGINQIEAIIEKSYTDSCLPNMYGIRRKDKSIIKKLWGRESVNEIISNFTKKFASKTKAFKMSSMVAGKAGESWL